MTFIGYLAVYTMIEFGAFVIAVIAITRRIDRRLIAATIVLAVLPLTWVGGNSDLAMRGAQLPMIVVMMAMFEAIRSAQLPGRIVLGGMVAIGMVASIQETVRLLRAPPAITSPSQVVIPNAYRTQYMAVATAPVFRFLALPPDRTVQVAE
jgi:hypothetical protein